jgi:hypothetical protein
MNYGNVVTVLPDKIRIGQKELEPIGISGESHCWGLWIPDRWAMESKVPHLVVSPFEPSSWPVLFRISLIVDHDSHGTLAKALKTLSEMDFNVLSIEGTPAGYHHAIVNLIGEAISIKEDKRMLGRASRLAEDKRNYTNTELQNYIHRAFAPRLLSYGRSLSEALYKSDRKNNFLRQAFVLGKRKGVGTLFNPINLPGPLQSFAKSQHLPAVRCHWLQNHAFFWIYGRRSGQPLEFLYDAPDSSLRPKNHCSLDYQETLSRMSLPARAIASTNFEEKYLRFVFSESDHRGNTVRIDIPYSAKFSDDTNTKGLLSIICDCIATQNIALRSINMTTSSRQKNQVDGKFSMLLTLAEAGIANADNSSILERARLAIKRATFIATTDRHFADCSVKFNRINITPHDGRTIFVSSKFDWITPTLRDGIKAKAFELGYWAIFGDQRSFSNDDRHHWEHNESPTTNITKMIHNSDAFLQIASSQMISGFECRSNNSDTSMNWLMFESGIAHAIELPIAICVDISDSVSIQKWKAALGPGTDRQLFTFSRESSEAAMLESFGQALRSLPSFPSPKRFRQNSKNL